jgi:hypothetical protein
MAAFTAFAIGMLIAGTVTKVAGDLKAGNAAKAEGLAQQDASESQAQLAEYNAAVAEVQARDAVARGAEHESKFRSGVRGIIGTQRAGIAAGNIDVGFGSAVDVQADSAFMGELDALTIRTNAAREAWGFKVQGEDLRRQAEIDRKAGRMQAAAGDARQSASRWNTVGSLLGTGSSLMGMKYGAGGTANLSSRTTVPLSTSYLPG